jgi:HB1/ASXL restriction endonuclease-like protein with HTH domain
MTYFQAALTILAHADRPLSVGELTAVALQRRLIRPRGRTPDRSMSSVLYRRLAADVDAPIAAIGGRFWLRGRPLDHEAPALRPAVRHSRRGSGTRAPSSAPRAARPSVLPAPPALPALEQYLQAGALLPEETTSAARRERQIAHLGDGLQRLASRLAPLQASALEWDAARTRARVMAPLLTLLGYRRADQRNLAPVRGRPAVLLAAGLGERIMLDLFRAAHTLSDADAHSTIGRAVEAGARWALLGNGRELRLYAATLPAAAADPSAALLLRLDLTPEGLRDQAATPLFWLLTRATVAGGSLEAYLDSRVVGAALLDALDDPASPVLAALQDAVQTLAGLRLPATLLARHARLALRSARGRDGEPLPEDVHAVAAITEPVAPPQAPAREDLVAAS